MLVRGLNRDALHWRTVAGVLLLALVAAPVVFVGAVCLHVGAPEAMRHASPGSVNGHTQCFV